MPSNLPNISFEKEKNNSTIDSPSSLYTIPFRKPQEYFSNLESKNYFIKGCEKLVRTNDRYKKYICHLKKEIKLDHCSVLKKLTDEDCDIEMHHGPIFSLYDYCTIVLNYYLYKGWKPTTFDIANIILEEHLQDHIHVVMLSTTIHEEVTNRQIFLNVNQAWGDLGKFLKIYHDGLDRDLKEKYNRYMDKSLMMDSETYDILKVTQDIGKFN